MTRTTLDERFCVWWWDGIGEEWVQHLALLLGWPYPVETLNEEPDDYGW